MDWKSIAQGSGLQIPTSRNIIQNLRIEIDILEEAAVA